MACTVSGVMMTSLGISKPYTDNDSRRLPSLYLHSKTPGDEGDGECKQEVCSVETEPECVKPLDACRTNTSQCVNDTWACVEASKACQDGFTCKFISPVNNTSFNNF